ncbi:MAG TPA: ATP-binding protein [Limnobacter sp.]|nr:ATP-binding protein [Limnobacter sp.]
MLTFNTVNTPGIDPSLDHRLQELADQLAQMTWTCDQQGRCSYVNQAWCDFSGTPRDSLLGDGWQTHVHPDDIERIVQLWSEAVKSGLRFTGRCRFRNSDGEYRLFECNGFPIHNHQGRIVSWFGTHTDIQATQDKESKISSLNTQLEQVIAERTKELQLSKVAAESANRAKTRLLGAISHELRNPLNAMAGMLFKLRKDEDRPTHLEALGHLENALDQLNTLVGEMLDLNRLEYGNLRLRLNEYDLTHLSEQLFMGWESRANYKGLKLELDIDPALPKCMVFDRERLQQVMGHLIANAVKFTLHGVVTLRLKAIAHNQNRCVVRIEVEDTGIGIAPSHQKSIFEPYAQAHAGIFSEFGGTGLGLRLVKCLVDLMGGTIGLRSVPSEGSLFWVELPFAVQPCSDGKSAEKISITKQSLAGVHVLVVDDMPMNVQVVANVLESYGASCIAASNGLEAIDILFQNNPLPVDLIIMDVHMPIMDGFQATRILRSNKPFQNIPILGFTGAAMDDMREQVLKAGMDDVLFKPIDPTAVVRTCVDLILKRGGGDTSGGGLGGGDNR